MRKDNADGGFLTAPFLEHGYLVEFIGAANMMTTWAARPQETVMFDPQRPVSAEGGIEAQARALLDLAHSVYARGFVHDHRPKSSKLCSRAS